MSKNSREQIDSLAGRCAAMRVNTDLPEMIQGKAAAFTQLLRYNAVNMTGLSVVTDFLDEHEPKEEQTKAA